MSYDSTQDPLERKGAADISFKRAASYPGTGQLARPRRSPKLRVGFVTPNMLMGGAEYWIIGLLKYTDRAQIALSGVAMTSSDFSDDAICSQAAAYAPLYGGPAQNGGAYGLTMDSPHVTRFSTVRQALKQLCDDSDVLVAWGVDCLDYYLGDLGFRGQVVLVSHGGCEWTRRIMEGSQQAVHHFVGVSRPAAAVFNSPNAIILSNGADHQRCRVTISREDVRRQWGVEPSKKLVGYVGCNSWEKNPLAAAQAVKRLGSGYQAVYVGRGWKDAEVKAKVLELTPDAIIAPSMTQIGNALNALDVFMLASPSEGFSLGLLEAWLCGVPTVATRVGAVPELEERHGKMVVPIPVAASPQQLAGAVRQALSPENQAVVDRARQVSWANYTAQSAADRWTEFLMKIAKRSSARGG